MDQYHYSAEHWLNVRFFSEGRWGHRYFLRSNVQ